MFELLFTNDVTFRLCEKIIRLISNMKFEYWFQHKSKVFENILKPKGSKMFEHEVRILLQHPNMRKQFGNLVFECAKSCSNYYLRMIWLFGSAKKSLDGFRRWSSNTDFYTSQSSSKIFWNTKVRRCLNLRFEFYLNIFTCESNFEIFGNLSFECVLVLFELLIFTNDLTFRLCENLSKMKFESWFLHKSKQFENMLKPKGSKMFFSFQE